MIFVATAGDGNEIRYEDRKRWLWVLSAFMPGVPAVSALAVWATGNAFFAVVPILVYFALVPLLDMLVGEDPDNPPEAVIEAMASDPHYRRLLFLAAFVLWAGFLTVMVVIATVAMPYWALALLVLASGIASGSGLTVAHELGHKPNRADQIGARLVAAITGYAHFTIEHNRGHHVMVATPEDHASARLGEGFHAFARREIPGVWRHGIDLERERLKKKGLPFWHWRNEVLQGYAVTAAVTILLVAAFGWWMLPLLAVHHFVGWNMLSLANYVEHYGLKRERRDNGRYAPCEPRHSWNTNHIVSNLLLFHLQRHSDHHANPLRPYQSLRNFEELPSLPSGYPGSFLLAFVPPLWRAVMDPKVMAWAGGDLSRTNLQPGCEAAYRKRFQASGN